MFSEVEDRYILVVINDAAGIVRELGLGREVGQEVDVVLEGVGVFVQLGLQYLVCCHGVGLSGVGVFEILVTVKLIGGRQGSLLHLVEYVLHVHQLALAEVEVHSGAEEFLVEDRKSKSTPARRNSS